MGRAGRACPWMPCRTPRRTRHHRPPADCRRALVFPTRRGDPVQGGRVGSWASRTPPPSAGRGTCETRAASGPERHLAPAGSAAPWLARSAPGGASPRGLEPCSAPSSLSLPPAGGFPSLRHPARLTASGWRRTARRLPPRRRSSSCSSSAARRGPARSCCWRRQNRADLRQIVAPWIVTPGSLRAAWQCGGRSSASPCGCRSVRARSRRERDPGDEALGDEAVDVARRRPPAGRDGHAP